MVSFDPEEIVDHLVTEEEHFFHEGSSMRKIGDTYYYVYTNLCIEPITINADGSIDEVQMTSQGIGAPFAPGDRIYGYQACELKGDLFIDVDDTYGEKLTHISQGDEAVFRYIKSEDGWTGITLTGAGSGKVKIMMRSREAGEQRQAEFLQGRQN